MSLSEQEVAKHLTALQKQIDEEIQWAVGGTVITDLGSSAMRQEHDGAIACTPSALHFFRKSMFGGTHLALALDTVESVEIATVGFANGEVDVLLLNRSEGLDPWAVQSPEEQLQFMLERLN